MKILLIDAFRAFRAAEKLSFETGLKRANAKRVFLLREALRPAYNYIREEEGKIFDLHPNYNPANGTLKITDDPLATREEQKDIVDALDELHDSEWEIEDARIPEKFVIHADESISNLTGNDIGALMPFIDFEDEEEE